AAIYLFAAYWAFSIRHSLVGRVYRNHALWLGVLCVLVAVQRVGNNSIDPTLNAIGGFTLLILFPVVFAFIDTTVRVARRSDPLLRSILHWESVRFLLWADLAALEAVIILTIVSPSFGNSDLGNILWTVLVFPVFIVGGSALLIGATRSGDPVLRRSLKWIGVVLFVAVLNMLVTSIIINLPNISPADFYYSYPALPDGAVSIVGAYAFYRSARSLAPINRLQAAEPETMPIPSTAEVL
ncbi:MAG TPA: hypothetical protein VKF39_02730, partial [Nitrososphaerales archaeon]|nr:hypothetical protein [Nitrososphaerales archaeon]